MGQAVQKYLKIRQKCQKQVAATMLFQIHDE